VIRKPYAEIRTTTSPKTTTIQKTPNVPKLTDVPGTNDVPETSDDVQETNDDVPESDDDTAQQMLTMQLENQPKPTQALILALQGPVRNKLHKKFDSAMKNDFSELIGLVVRVSKFVSQKQTGALSVGKIVLKTDIEEFSTRFRDSETVQRFLQANFPGKTIADVCDQIMLAESPEAYFQYPRTLRLFTVLHKFMLNLKPRMG
jgi:hypothetical protein